MDFQNRPGAKYGQGVMMTSSDAATTRRELQRKLLLETTDLTNDPYVFKNHLGQFECRLCLTMHSNEGSYLAHTRGKKHQTNLKKSLSRDVEGETTAVAPVSQQQAKNLSRIGLPAYTIQKEVDPITAEQKIHFEVHYGEIIDGTQPDYRIINAFEQKMEAPDNSYLYLLFAADPYETICVKIPNKRIKTEGNYTRKLWDRKSRRFYVTIWYEK